MTPLIELHALAEKWREHANQWCESGEIVRARFCRAHSDELTELLGKVVVTDEMVQKSMYVFDCNTSSTYPHCPVIAMRAVVESVLGVTKSSPACDHDWTEVNNAHVKHTTICFKCGAIQGVTK